MPIGFSSSVYRATVNIFLDVAVYHRLQMLNKRVCVIEQLFMHPDFQAKSSCRLYRHASRDFFKERANKFTCKVYALVVTVIYHYNVVVRYAERNWQPMPLKRNCHRSFSKSDSHNPDLKIRICGWVSISLLVAVRTYSESSSCSPSQLPPYMKRCQQQSRGLQQRRVAPRMAARDKTGSAALKLRFCQAAR